MKIYFLSILLTLSSVIPQKLLAQNVQDSLIALIRKSDGLKKGELNIELANHYLPSNADSAAHYASIALNIAKKINSPTLTIRSYAATGDAYQRQNKMKEAISSYLKGLQIAEKLNEKSLAGTLYNGIGVCYFYLNDPNKAEKYLRLAAEAKKEANDYRYYALISTNLATLQIANQLPDKAVKTLKAVEKALVKNKQPEYLSTVYNSLGAAYQSVKPDSCLYYYEKSIDIASKNKDYVNLMSAYQNIGEYYAEKKNFSEAIAYMKKAISTNELRAEDPFKTALYERVSALYYTIGDFKNAYLYKKLETETHQKLFSVAKQKEIEELEIKYQSEKKEKQIQLHKQETEKAKNQRNLVLFMSFSIMLIAGSITYLIFQKRKILRHFEQEKLKMFENIFHEIRTPLTLITGPIQMMSQHSDSNDNELLQLLDRNATKLTRLVDELLDASKVGRNSFQLHYTVGDIGEFVADLANSFTGEAISKDIELAIDAVHLDGYYSFPANAVEKIVSNLIGNAIKYSPSNSKIWIRSEIVGDHFIATIEDSGPGIPQSERKKIFKRFFRGSNSSQTSGTGIGLSLVKELVELAQGTIALESTPAGSSFKVSIPIVKTYTFDSNATEGEAILLLAEDDPDTAAFTIAVLKENFKIIHVKNGQEAIDIIRQNLPDIVLSDIMMPEKDGIELLQEIRSSEISRHLPVVLFSAKASLESRLSGLRYGADAYISKPFSPEELKLTVGNLLATIQRNKEAYQVSIRSAKKFEERIKSDNEYVNRTVAFIIEHIDDHEYSVNELADDMAVSRSQLHRKLVSLTSFSTTNFIRIVRLEKAKDLLQDNEGNVSEIAYRCGFSSQSYFTKSFTEYFGKSPTHFLKNH